MGDQANLAPVTVATNSRRPLIDVSTEYPTDIAVSSDGKTAYVTGNWYDFGDPSQAYGVVTPISLSGGRDVPTVRRGSMSRQRRST